MFHKLSQTYQKTALIKLIALGLCIGIVIALAAPGLVPLVSVFGEVFVMALKGVAPILVFILVMNAMAQKSADASAAMKPIVRLYVIGTFLASLVGVTMSFLFPTTLHLQVADTTLSPPGGIIEVLHNLILKVVDNPIHALADANYIGILAWGVLAGLALHSASDGTKNFLSDVAKSVTKIVQWVIRFAPFGIMGLVADAIGTSGLNALLGYAHLLAVLLGAFFLVALVMNPLIVFLHIHRNPYPLVLTTLRESGIYAFFTRSSAANIPVNLSLCKRLGLNEDTYSVSIPLGATINMSGAAITIAVLSLAAAHTMGV
ncbi:MAG: serine/threonine transporter SstT, partial [Selenomonadaceae bacterium]|nr:serine/threonine transporter SstT [Selenomonadaceae bacterium]